MRAGCPIIPRIEECFEETFTLSTEWKEVENPGIDPGASRMQIERSTTWASPPLQDDIVMRG